MKRIWLIPAALAALAIAVATPIAFGAWNPFAASYPQGVDVSWHQGPIDWPLLGRSGVRFAYVKATEGADYVDPRFAFNWREAGQAGLYRGAYHYFTLCRPGLQQAQNFIHSVPREANALPPAVDLEHMGPCRHGPTMTDVDAEVRAFLARIEAYYGVRPIIYASEDFRDAHLKEFPRERFWIRSLIAPPLFQREWIVWQHHNGAHRPGVSGPVDLDAFRGNEAALARFAQSHEPNT